MKNRKLTRFYSACLAAALLAATMTSCAQGGAGIPQPMPEKPMVQETVTQSESAVKPNDSPEQEIKQPVEQEQFDCNKY